MTVIMYHRLHCKEKYSKFETNTPRKGIARPKYFHIHVSVCSFYIPTIDLPILLQEMCGPILGIDISFTATCMWKLGLRLRYSQKRNT